MTCALCGTPLSEAVTVGTTARHGEAQHSVACARCGLVQATPLPTEAELAAYYDGRYREQFQRAPVSGHEWGSPEAERLMDEGAARYAAEIVETLGLGAGSSVLEVGCGDGRLSAAIRPRVLQVKAIEADGEMVLEAHARGVSAVAVTLDTMASLYEDEPGMYRYDAAISCHVLEHFRDPLEALRQMRSLLVTGGKVWIEVPNTLQPYNDLDAHWFQTPHLFNFTPHTLALALIRAGFENVNLAERGHVLFAWAVSGAREPMSFAEAEATFLRTTGTQGLPSGADIARHLDAYRARWRVRQSKHSAASVLSALRDGERPDVPADVRDAVLYMLEESHRAARIASAALRDGYAMAMALDATIAEAEEWSADPWLLGYRAGAASMAARASHMVGMAANRWKAIEVGE